MPTGSHSGSNSSSNMSEDGYDVDSKYTSGVDVMGGYLVKDLDSGRSYRVEEIDQHYSLVTLDSAKEQLNQTYDVAQMTHRDSVFVRREDLLSMYSADATTVVEIEPPVSDSEQEEDHSIEASAYGDVKERTMKLLPCLLAKCTTQHTRVSGYCPVHEVQAKEKEDSRAQAVYLIPVGKEASFVRIKGHAFVEDAMSRLYTVYIIEMTCADHQWCVYRRYRDFTALYDQCVCQLKVKKVAIKLPPLPPKKIIGSFEPDFISKRQTDLGLWIDSLLTQEPSAVPPQTCDDIVRFLTHTLIRC
ncbi:hypothetical protein DYB37_004129 [Aphanomyces astaci]|uniref:PX domain-containing protein n=1 Tax=Aphanomyces astaci TaxID=112090 RepID=A0A3R6WHC1_APHAT|nr:hypothetical protein DYB35_004831 [Aphanomyces astaci]RHZ18328.1 hypothetical protein DYB37_004129 [Aphanomyces astaci]